MPVSPKVLTAVRFEGFELDVRAGELRGPDGGKTRLGEQPFRILIVLLENPGGVVLRETIRKKLWPNDTIVEFEHSIGAAMNRLRQALGDSADKPKYIETLARRGYRWMTEVERVEGIPAVEMAGSAEQKEMEAAGGDLIGRTVSHYKVLQLLGSGGMGIVYKAEDVKLSRRVALKFLPEGMATDPRALERFQREALAISGLDHPNICTIYEVEEHVGQPFLVMQLLEGQTLRERIESHTGQRVCFRNEELLDISLQIASGLEVAHQKGLIHRDIKPANIFLTNRGEAKILDFGLAKLVESAEPPETLSPKNMPDGAALPESPVRSTVTLSLTGLALGTPAYLSPEQVSGEKLDARTDVYSFGLVLYEMATGIRAIAGNTAPEIHEAILDHPPRAVRELNPEVSRGLEQIVHRAINKDREARYRDASEMREDLLRLKRGASASRRPWKIGIAAALVLLSVACVSAGFLNRHYARIRWVREVAVPAMEKLGLDRKGVAFYQLARQAERYSPNSPELKLVETKYLRSQSILSTPAGADVYFRAYGDSIGDWEYLGKTPLEGKFLWAEYAMRFVKDGYEPVEVASEYILWSVSNNIILDPIGSLPKNMVHVSPGEVNALGPAPIQLDEFLVDKYEVTNLEFKKFMDAGGYREPKYWKFPFTKDGRAVTFDQAMALFVDKTDRTAPSTWDLGNFPAGQENYPVGGVSWYEAAAYAEFVGKSLPTVHHWYQASSSDMFSGILNASNFSGKGPAPVGSYAGLGLYGTYDMAGNVKEWCFNSDGTRRFILGGSSSEPKYMSQEPDVRPAFDRSEDNGFRLVKYLKPEPLPEAQTSQVSIQVTDYRNAKPVPDSVFRAYQGLYSYDRTPLDALIESVDDSSPHWRRERITFKAAYNNERVTAFLYLPRNVSPPYQTVVHFPGAEAQAFHTFSDMDLFCVDFLMKGGRAVMFPLYKGTYERNTHPTGQGASEFRDETIQRSKDMRRSLDYLETRPDIDHNRLAFYGFSWGGSEGPISLALESRFKTAVLADGGCNTGSPSEVDPINFAPHIKIPVLMINGRYDPMRPLEGCQQPFFRLLGTPSADKRHVLLESGHGLPYTPWFKETLDWLDRYLGRVN
jgi:serine/threonine protein kinase/dienelactone hydrolase